MAYAIRFQDEDATWWAGWTGDGTLGIAPTFKTAAVWDVREVAERFLQNGYGPRMTAIGEVVEV